VLGSDFFESLNDTVGPLSISSTLWLFIVRPPIYRTHEPTSHEIATIKSALIEETSVSMFHGHFLSLI